MVDMLKNIDWAKVPDEPWVFGIPVGGERTFLREVGLDLRSADDRR
jgi:hypothetical protein